MTEGNKKTIHILEFIIDTIEPALIILIFFGLFLIFISKPLIGVVLSIILVSGFILTPSRKIVSMLSIPVFIFLVISYWQLLQPTTNYEKLEKLEKPVICNQYNKNDFISYVEAIEESPTKYSPILEEGRMHMDDQSPYNIYCECNKIMGRYFNELGFITLKKGLDAALDYIDDEYNNMKNYDCFESN